MKGENLDPAHLGIAQDARAVVRPRASVKPVSRDSGLDRGERLLPGDSQRCIDRMCKRYKLRCRLSSCGTGAFCDRTQFFDGVQRNDLADAYGAYWGNFDDAPRLQDFRPRFEGSERGLENRDRTEEEPRRKS